MKIFDARFNGNRTNVLQALGTTWTVNISATDALREVDGDFAIKKFPLYASIVADFQPTTRMIRVHNRHAIVAEKRPEMYTVFGECGDAYNVVQRRDLCMMIDRLTVRWPLETMGMLDGGQTLFVTLNAGNVDIAGDPVTMYFVIIDTVDGGTSTKSIFTPVRVQCQNTLITGVKKAIANAAIRHGVNVARDTSFSMKLMERMANSQVQTIAMFEQMAMRKLNSGQISKIIEAAYPLPKIPTKVGLLNVIEENDLEFADLREESLKAENAFQYYVDRARIMQKSAAEVLDLFNQQNPTLANTAWAVYNAVVELADWRSGTDSADRDAVFGQRAVEKKRAFAAALNQV